MLNNNQLFDSILNMDFGLLWASWGILRDAMHLLMEGSSVDISLSDLVRALEQLDGYLRTIGGANAQAGLSFCFVILRIESTCLWTRRRGN